MGSTNSVAHGAASFFGILALIAFSVACFRDYTPLRNWAKSGTFVRFIWAVVFQRRRTFAFAR